MIYIYPKYSKTELFGIRFLGAGLGNLLFMWSRAIVATEQHGCEIIWPTWPSIKVGPWIRRERDKRFYGDLFKCKTYKNHGIKKYCLLLFKKKIHCRNYENIDWDSLPEECVLICDGFNLRPGELQMNFDGLREYRELICRHIYQNLRKKSDKALSFSADQSINIHVRLGDFASNSKALAEGKNNTRIDIGWYANTLTKIREAAGWCVPANVFSDGTDNELAELTDMPNVKRVFFGNSISDIIALSKAPLVIASGSSFSLWGRFLGECSSISYPNQMKDRVLSEGTGGFEIELSSDAPLCKSITDDIRFMYSK